MGCFHGYNAVFSAGGSTTSTLPKAALSADTAYAGVTSSGTLSTVLHVAEDTPEYKAHTPLARRQGEVLRLATALVEGARVTSSDRKEACNQLKRFCAKAVGQHTLRDGEVCTDEELGKRLMALARQSHQQLSKQLELLVRFSDTERYRLEGCRTMVQWMDVHLGMGRIAASEHLRVGRALRELPMCDALFALGKMSYTKARIITRLATAETDEAFATETLDLSATETEAWCERFRHEQDAEAIAAAEDGEAKAALIAHDRRALRTRDIDAYSTRITLDLPKDMAAEFLRSLEQCDDEAFDQVRSDAVDKGQNEVREKLCAEAASHVSETNGNATAYVNATAHVNKVPSAVQRRADAAVLMSRHSLAHAGESVSMADRFRVHVTIDSATLAGALEDKDAALGDSVKAKPMMDGTTPVSPATVRRIAEVAGFTAYAVDAEGDPVASKKVAAPFTKRQLRALRARDGCCQMPGCGATRHLDGHHVIPRSDGGQSTFDNAVLLCGGCHRLMHEGGYRLERESISNQTKTSDQVRRYRLFGSDGTEYGSRGAVIRHAEKSETKVHKIGAVLFPRENMVVDEWRPVNENSDLLAIAGLGRDVDATLA